MQKPRHREIRGAGKEFAALQSLEELSVNLDAGNAALAVGRRNAVISSRNRSHADEHGLPAKARRPVRASSTSSISETCGIGSRE